MESLIEVFGVFGALALLFLTCAIITSWLEGRCGSKNDATSEGAKSGCMS